MRAKLTETEVGFYAIYNCECHGALGLKY